MCAYLPFISQEKVKRCFIEMYCSAEFDFSQITIPFERFGGEYTIQFMACAISAANERAELFMESDYVRRGVLKRRLMALGCRGVTVHSFSRNDTERLAEKFYGRVMEKANKPGAIFYTRGTASIEPLVERVSEDYDVWYQELLELGQREKMVIHTYQIPGSSDEDEDGMSGGASASLPQVGSVRQLTAAESSTTSVQRSGGGKRRMVVSAPVEGVVVRELTEKAEELECIAGVLDERVAEGQKRLEECEAARQAEGEQLRALLAEQKAEYEARLEAAAAQHRALVVAKEAEWEARLAGKVLELMSVSGSGSASSDARAEHDARVAAVVAECEAKLAAKDVACGERLAAREAEHARSKDVLDAKKLRDLKAAHQKEMDRRLTKLRLELADERRLGGRLRAELAEAQGRVDELEDQVGAAGDEDEDEDGMIDQGTMRGMQESARNQHLKDLLVNAAVMRNGAWLERDAAKDRVVELEKKLDEKNLEMEMAVHRLRVEIRGLEVVIADEKQLRRREGKGDIFHEDGRVLIKCSKCFQVLQRLFSLYLIIHQTLPPP